MRRDRGLSMLAALHQGIGRLPPALLTELASDGVNGRPVCMVRIPFMSQPPSDRIDRVAMANVYLRPTPKGSAIVHGEVKR